MPVPSFQVVTTTVPTNYVDDLSSGLEKSSLFGYASQPAMIDVYFVQMIDSGGTAGVTLTRATSTWWQQGIAIADGVGIGGAVPLQDQDVVRTLAHEIVHYLLNHFAPESSDHRDDEKNLMYWDTAGTKRDLDLAQCLEIRANRGGE